MDFFRVIGDYIADSWAMVVGGAGGPFLVRLLVQPVVAAIFAVRAGRADARAGRPPFFWSLFTAGDRYDRRRLLLDGGGNLRNAFIAAVVLDVIYGLAVFHWVYPVQTLIVVIVLAMIPYLIVRGLATRMAGAGASK